MNSSDSNPIAGKAKRFDIPNHSKIEAEKDRVMEILRGARCNGLGFQGDQLDQVYREICSAFYVSRYVPLATRAQLQRIYDEFVKSAESVLAEYRRIPLDLRPGTFDEESVVASIEEIKLLRAQWCGGHESLTASQEAGTYSEQISEELAAAKLFAERHDASNKQVAVQQRDILLARLVDIWRRFHPASLAVSITKSNGEFRGPLLELVVKLLSFEGVLISGGEPINRVQVLGEAIFDARKLVE